MPGKARLYLIAAIIVAALTTGACGGSSTSEDTEGTDPTTTSAPAAEPGEKASANTASVEDIAEALESAGVNNADRWAHEVVEYRPYPPDDFNLQKLRDNLDKYNPGEETVNKIVSALTP